MHGMGCRVNVDEVMKCSGDGLEMKESVVEEVEEEKVAQRSDGNGSVARVGPSLGRASGVNRGESWKRREWGVPDGRIVNHGEICGG